MQAPYNVLATGMERCNILITGPGLDSTFKGSQSLSWSRGHAQDERNNMIGALEICGFSAQLVCATLICDNLAMWNRAVNRVTGLEVGHWADIVESCMPRCVTNREAILVGRNVR